MEIHHGRHHAAYVRNLNAQIEKFPELTGLSIEAIQKNISKFNTAVRNNGGGHYNHSIFWLLMAPEGKRGEPSVELESAIKAEFGSFEDFKKIFAKEGLARFGSGWAWLIVTPERKLKICSTPNQDNPLMDIPEIEHGTPILCIDLWEHAYYLKYQNKRDEYIDNWWKVVNWNEVSRRFKEAMK